MDALYIRTAIAPLLHGDVPGIDRDLLRSLLASYQFMAYQLVRMGHPVAESPASGADTAGLAGFYADANTSLLRKS